MGQIAQKALLGLAAMAPALSGVVLATGFYVAPGQAYLDACRKAAIAGSRDEVLFSTVRVSGEAVSVRLYVGAKDGGRERVVICDGEPGKISRIIPVDSSRD